jgi:antitoxin component YwqK of YwqJK toxin-antitoxin module
MIKIYNSDGHLIKSCERYMERNIVSYKGYYPYDKKSDRICTDMLYITDKKYICIMYFPNGKIYDCSVYYNGVRHGKRYEFYKNNSLMRESYYINGHIHGISKIYSKYDDNDNDTKYMTDIFIFDIYIIKCNCGILQHITNHVYGNIYNFSDIKYAQK